MKGLSLAIEIGTTSCRAELYNQAGDCLTKASAQCTIQVPRSGWVEQDPEEIYAAVMNCLRQISSSEAETIILSSVFHSFIPLDAKATPLGLMWTWADTRAVEQANLIKSALPGLYERTACPYHPMYLSAKIAWFKEHQTGKYSQTRHFVGIKEYVLFRWFGRFLVDRSLASGTGLYNFKSGDWDSALLNYLGISPEYLSEIVDTDYKLTVNSPSPLTEVGIKKGTILVIGAGDGVLSSLGTGAVSKGKLTASIGTSGAIRVCSPIVRTDYRGRAWCYNLNKDLWVIGGAINNGGLAYRWVRDNFMEREAEEAREKGLDDYELINQQAMKIPPGSDGLIFLPYLAGERSPYWNANARGVLIGLGLNHTRYHIARATVEGVVFRMYSVFQVLKDLAGPIEEVRLTGAVTSSSLWVQTVADVFQREVLLSQRHGSLFGAWILFQYSLGRLDSLLEAEYLAGKMESFRPRTELASLYGELFELYSRVYEKLQGEFLQISHIQQRLGLEGGISMEKVVV